MLDWTRDPGYSGEETARAGRYAIVICPPDFTDGGWGFQVFDEDDDEALENGETMARAEGFRDAGAVKEFLEAIARAAK